MIISRLFYNMKSYDELRVENGRNSAADGEAKKNEHDNALKEVTRLCKEFGFTADMPKCSLA